MACQVALANLNRFLSRHPGRRPHQGHPGRTLRIAAALWRCHKQAGPWIAQQILRMHRHRADQKDRLPLVVQPVGHHRPEGPARLLARERRETTR